MHESVAVKGEYRANHRQGRYAYSSRMQATQSKGLLNSNIIEFSILASFILISVIIFHLLDHSRIERPSDPYLQDSRLRLGRRRGLQVAKQFTQSKLNKFKQKTLKTLKIYFRYIKEAIPFAVVGSTQTFEVKGKKVRGRVYPWGVVEIENIEHNDFVKLRTMLM